MAHFLIGLFEQREQMPLTTTWGSNTFPKLLCGIENIEFIK
jgi:hypothetical protein